MPEPFELHIDPSPQAAQRFSAWRDDIKARLEAAGITVTEITGTTFIGHYDPGRVDLDTIEF